MDFERIKAAKKESALYMVNEITHIIKTFDKREPGSKGETDAINYMKETLEPIADDVKTESFQVTPRAFFGWIYFTVSIALAGYICLYFLPVLTVVLFLLAFSFLIGEFLLYREIVDPVFPKAVSHNLTAVIKPKGEVKRRVLINGHPDAAYEWPVNYHLGGAAFVAHFVITMLGCIYVVVLAIISIAINGVEFHLLTAGWLRTACLVSLVFIPFFIGMYFLSNERRVVDGANDNLTGCYLGIALLKAMKDNNVELENTEVGVLITGSEEAGLRGAKAWCKEHAEEYKNDGVETIIFSFDTIREARFLSVNTRDLNNLVKSDKYACDLFKKAADNIGIYCGEGTVPFGATDNAAFNQAGLRSAGITALDHNLRNYYHTRRDTYDNLDADCLADTFAVLAEAIREFDAGE